MQGTPVVQAPSPGVAAQGYTRIGRDAEEEGQEMELTERGADDDDDADARYLC